MAILKSDRIALQQTNQMLGNTLVGRYQIISYLGGGGFGETFVACDTQLPGSPQCVVKKLKPPANDPVTLQTSRRLFDTEAQVLYLLGTHDRIPQLLAYFEENKEFYLVQELIEGHDLGKEITPGNLLPQDQMISLLTEILEILEFVHNQKVIHRDINPRNLIRRKFDGRLVLIDFGAVKQIVTQMVTPVGKTNLTIAIGTPGYIPSEQAQGHPKLSSDIYAVGILGIQALTGLAPDQLEKDPDTNEIIWRNHTTVSDDLANFLDKMVRYDFRQRFPSATVALQALRELTTPQTGTIQLNIPTKVKPSKNRNWNLKKLAFKVLGGTSLIGIGVAISLYLINTIHSVNANELYKQANTLYELQRYQDALSTYKKAVNLRPDYAQAWNGQGKTLYELQKYREALTVYDKAIQLEPDFLEAWMGRGFVLNKLRRYQEAIASFDKALQLEDENPEVWYAKGEALRRSNQYDEAIKSYAKAVELQPEYYQAWHNQGLVLHTLKRYEDAIAAYDKVVELKPNYSQAWYNRGNALMNLRRYQDALAAYSKAVQYQPEYSQAWLSRGNVLISLQQYQDAIDSFKEVIKYNPKNYQAWNGRGWSLHQMQRYEEAITAYNQAIKIKRNYPQAWYNLGNSLYSLKKYKEAIASYDQATRYKPEHYETWYSKGNAFVNMERYQEAIAVYNRAIQLKPDGQQAIEARNQAQAMLEVIGQEQE